MDVSDLTDLASMAQFEPAQLIGIPFALAGAVCLSIGAQLQHAGVGKVEADHGDPSRSFGLNFRQFFNLLKRKTWLAGTLMLGLAVVLQLISLAFSPLIVVQPLGAIALVITAIMNSRITKEKLNRASIIAIGLCIVGVGAFVTIAAFTAVNTPVTVDDLIQIMITLGVIAVVFAAIYGITRGNIPAIFHIMAAGILYGFVATLAKAVETRILHGDLDTMTWICIAALLIATVLGGFFVQNAYASGPPDLVIAGLTVVDPLVAVCIGIVILDEAQNAPGWAIGVYVVSGIIAIAGVLMLSLYHPQNGKGIKDGLKAGVARSSPGAGR